MTRVILFLLVASFQQLNAQYISGVMPYDSTLEVINDTNDLSYKYAQHITAEEMKNHLSVLASDEFEGRETGTPGNDKSAEYIAEHFKNIGLLPGGLGNKYFQPIAFTFTKWKDTDIYVNGNRYKHLWDYVAFPNKNPSAPAISDEEIIFLGYGVDTEKYSDYKKKDVEGKIIMINKGEPVDKDSLSRITGTKTMSEWSNNIDLKLDAAKKHGAKLVLIIEDNIKKLLAENRRLLLRGMMSLGDKSNETISYVNHAYISTNIAKEIIGDEQKKVIKARERITKKGKNKDVKLEANFVINMTKDVSVLKGNNVIGYIRGKDIDGRQEYVVVSAHHDHIGKRGDEVYNGADDNGSGTTAVLEIAEAFQKAAEAGHGPDRNMVFILVTGEEKGLLGSQYYTENPMFPLEKTVVDVNIDMIGRVDQKYAADSNYIYVIGSDRLSTSLHNLNESVNKSYSNLTLDYTFNDENDPNRYYYRSDHYNFAKNGIPSIFFFSGVHEDYHQPGDEVDKINFPKMEKVGRHIFHLLWELGNYEQKLPVDGEIK